VVPVEEGGGLEIHLVAMPVSQSHLENGGEHACFWCSELLLLLLGLRLVQLPIDENLVSLVVLLQKGFVFLEPFQCKWKWFPVADRSPVASPGSPFPHPPKLPSQTDGRSEFIYKIVNGIYIGAFNVIAITPCWLLGTLQNPFTFVQSAKEKMDDGGKMLT
jgi:hypothetical protein